MKLTRYASVWFDNLKTKLNEGKGAPRITTWTEMKRQLKNRFVPREYIQDNYLKLNQLQQRYLSVTEYTTEFERLCYHM